MTHENMILSLTGLFLVQEQRRQFRIMELLVILFFTIIFRGYKNTERDNPLTEKIHTQKKMLHSVKSKSCKM